MQYIEANRRLYSLIVAQEKAEKIAVELACEYWEVKKEKLAKNCKNERDLMLSEFEIINQPVYDKINRIISLYSQIKQEADSIDWFLKRDKDFKK